MSYRRLIPLVLGTSLCLVLVLLLLDSRQASPARNEGHLPRSARDERPATLLQEIREAQRANARALRDLAGKVHAPVGPALASDRPLRPVPAAAGARWKAKLREAEEDLVAGEVVRLKLKLLKQAEQLRTRLSALDSADRQFPVTQHRLQGTEGVLERLSGVRTLDELVRLTSHLP